MTKKNATQAGSGQEAKSDLIVPAINLIHRPGVEK